MAAAPFLVRRLIEPRASITSIIRVQLALVSAIYVATLGLLVFLVLFLLPAPLMSAAGLGCTHSLSCQHGLPLWAQFGLWLPPAGLLAWLASSGTRAFLCSLRSSRRVRRLAERRGCAAGGIRSYPIYELQDERVFACTVGIVRPILVVSSGLRDSLDPDQFAVVLAHERGHAAGRHNLVLLVSRVIERTLFFVPGITRSYEQILRLIELVADETAAKRTGDALSVASTVTHVARLVTRSEQPPTMAIRPGITYFSRQDLVVERVERLVLHQPAGVSRRRLISGILVLSLVFLLLCSSGYALGKSSLAGADQTAACGIASSLR